MVNRVYLVPGKNNIIVWDSWTPLVLANSKAITTENTISITRYDNGRPVVYNVGGSDNPKNFTQLIKNVTYFFEVKIEYWLYNAVSPGTAVEQSAPKPVPKPKPAPTPAPASAPAPAPTPTPDPDPAPTDEQALLFIRADLERLLGAEVVNRTEADRFLSNQFQKTIQSAIAQSQPFNQNLTNISALACTAFGLGFLALENAQQGREKIGALSAEDLNAILSDLRRLIAAKQPSSDALNLLSSIGISDFALRLLILESESQLRDLVGIGDIAASLLSELRSKQPLSEQLSALSALKATDFGRQLLALADAPSARRQIGAASAEDLQRYTPLTNEGTIPVALLPSLLSVLAKLQATDFGLTFLTLRDAPSARSQIGALSVEDLKRYAQLTADGILPLSVLPSELTALASLKATDFGRALLTLVDASSARRQIGAAALEDLQRYAQLAANDLLPLSLLPLSLQSLGLLSATDFGRTLLELKDAASARNRIGAVSSDDLQSYARLTGNGTIPTSLLPNQSLVNIVTVSSAAEMLALTDIQPGDTVIRRDLNTRKIFTLTQLPASDLGNWERSSLGIQTLNGQSGPVVNLAAGDVGADSAGSASLVRDLLLQHEIANNPHRITPEGIGADVSGAAAAVGKQLEKHMLDTDNPHKITPSQLGLGSAALQPASAFASPKVRQSVPVALGSVAAGQAVFASVSLGKSFKLLRVETSASCWFRLYSSANYRSLDSNRTLGAELAPGNGLISEINFAGILGYDLDNTQGSSMENPANAVALVVMNTATTSATIALTLYYLKLED